jgi:HTH-type transcriptional regulator/antitoxin HigA
MTTGLKPPSSYYLELIVNFPPRPIANEAEYEATQTQINKILERFCIRNAPRTNLTEDDRAYLKILGLTIYDYEEKHEQLPSLSGVELIHALLEESSLTLQDLVPVLGSETQVLAILKGEQSLTSEYIEKLSSFFGIAGDRFLK